jgi:predicted HTH domain antitoxin
MSVLISDEILEAAQISETELKREIAVLLFQQKNWVSVRQGN